MALYCFLNPIFSELSKACVDYIFSHSFLNRGIPVAFTRVSSTTASYTLAGAEQPYGWTEQTNKHGADQKFCKASGQKHFESAGNVFLLTPTLLCTDIHSAILTLYPKTSSTSLGYCTSFLIRPLSVFAWKPLLCPHLPQAPSAVTANSETYWQLAWSAGTHMLRRSARKQQ